MKARLLPCGPAFTAAVAVVVLVLCCLGSVAALPQHERASAAPKAFVPLADARVVIEALRQVLPGELVGRTPEGLESAWREWVIQRDAAIRARVARGDEESVVHFWHYGTSFTTLPPVTERTSARLGGADTARILEQRLADFLTALATPGGDERLQFARHVVERRGIDLRTSAGRAQVRLYLQELRQRVVADYDEHRRTLASMQHAEPVTALAAFATMFRDRGLSSDTSVLPAFAIEQALEQVREHGLLAAGRVRRVAIVGPGLDFVNKDDGYDFYPQQTIQPFAVMDSLIRLGLSNPEELVVVTFDVSARVTQHIEAARARAGSGYTMHLPLDADERWRPDLVTYWERFGDQIGSDTQPVAAPPNTGGVRTRAVRIRPARVRSVVPRDVNIVLERIDPLAANERFDLVVATNILVYYDVFEQQLALVNIGTMLRTGGVLLPNTPVPPVRPLKMSGRYTTVQYSEGKRDQVFWYERE